MFRIECFCDDNKLAKIHWLLTGHVYNLTSEPVVNAKKANGQVKPRAATGEIEELFADYARKHKLRTVNAESFRAFVTHIGYAERSYSFFLNKLKDAKLLKMAPGSKPPFNVNYTVMLGNAKPRVKAATKSKKAASKEGVRA